MDGWGLRQFCTIYCLTNVKKQQRKPTETWGEGWFDAADHWPTQVCTVEHSPTVTTPMLALESQSATYLELVGLVWTSQRLESNPGFSNWEDKVLPFELTTLDARWLLRLEIALLGMLLRLFVPFHVFSLNAVHWMNYEQRKLILLAGDMSDARHRPLRSSKCAFSHPGNWS